MSRLGLAALIAMIAAMAIATTTLGASFDRHFTVISRFVSGEERQGKFQFKLKLVDKLDHSDKVGDGRGRCNDVGRKIWCRVRFHFNGEVSGRGDLVIKGDEGHGDTTFHVAYGSRDFAGVTGKMVIRPEPGDKEDRFRFDLVR